MLLAMMQVNSRKLCICKLRWVNIGGYDFGVGVFDTVRVTGGGAVLFARLSDNVADSSSWSLHIVHYAGS